MIIAAILTPITIVVGFKVFPRTPVGKKLILKPTTETAADRGSSGVTEEDYSQLLDKKGKTITPLRPSGIAEIEGNRYSVVAEGEMINKGIEIVVINIKGNNIVVDQANS